MVPSVNCPISIFHGTDDEVIYFESAVKLEKLLKHDDMLIPITGAHHNDLVAFEVYHLELAKILL